MYSIDAILPCEKLQWLPRSGTISKNKKKKKKNVNKIKYIYKHKITNKDWNMLSTNRLLGAP